VNPINILGINVNTYNKQEVLAKLVFFLTSDKQHYLATPNPEMILEATSRDEELFYILNKADLSLPDGMGLKIAAWFLGSSISRITGADLTKDILALAEKNNQKVAVLNWGNGLSSAENISQALANQYPGLKFIAQDIARKVIGQDDIIEVVKKFQPTIIFVALGAPWQEKFIFHNLSKLSSIKIAIGVGGVFDFLTKKIKRAPKILRAIGLEWLWRLAKQPWRWRRIYRATIVFPAKFFLWRFIYPFKYRPNVVCLLYQTEQGRGGEIIYKILIVERADEPGHWQLPQGGRDGEDLLTAGQRELAEEINSSKFKPVVALDKLHVYEFGEKISKFGVKAKLARGYKGQKQGLFIAEFFGDDEDIKINHWEHRNWQWVNDSELVSQVHPLRRQATKIFLNKFKQIVADK